MDRDREVRNSGGGEGSAPDKAPQSAQTVQLKEELAGLAYPAQTERLQPSRSVQMAKASTPTKPGPDHIRSAADKGISGSSKPVPHKAAMEQSFGVSLDHVSAHTGQQAKDACSAMGARAYTTGNDIAFKTESPSRGLVAHELTHVMQQQGKAAAKGEISTPGDKHEREADATAARVERGESVSDVAARHGAGGGRSAAASGGIQRKEEPEGAEGDTADSAESPEKMKPGPEKKAPVQMDSAYGGTHGAWAKFSVDPVAHKLVGNLTPGSSGSYQIAYKYQCNNGHGTGDVKAKLRGPGGTTEWGYGDLGGNAAMKFGAGLGSGKTKPGGYVASIEDKASIWDIHLYAGEVFSVVAPVRIDRTRPSTKLTLLDFDNPIPIQLEGGQSLSFKLSASHTASKGFAVNRTGSTSKSVTEKRAFGLGATMDDDAGSKAGAELGFSSSTQQGWRDEWKDEEYHKAEISGTEWQGETFTPGAGESRSIMIIPEYEWVEWNAEVYNHNPTSLVAAESATSVKIGMLRPTGGYTPQDASDPNVGRTAQSDPTEGAQVAPDRSDDRIRSQSDEQVRARGAWRTIKGALWGSGTLQFIKGPISMTPAERDYRAQDGKKIMMGTGTSSRGGSFSVSLEDGMVGSRSATESGVTNNAQSWSLSSAPGIKGIGNIGVSASEETQQNMATSTGTGLSHSSSSRQTTTVSYEASVNKKLTTEQMVIYTPLVSHKVFQVAYGAEKPSTRPYSVDPSTACSHLYMHTYKHQPIPHIKIMDVAEGVTPPRGKVNWPTHTPV